MASRGAEAHDSFMAASKGDYVRWRRRFEVAARREHEALAQEGARPAWATAVALSMIEAAEPLARSSPVLEAAREREAARVRGRWATLRQRLLG